MGLAGTADEELEREVGEAKGGRHTGQTKFGGARTPGAAGHTGGGRERGSSKPSEPGTARPGT